MLADAHISSLGYLCSLKIKYKICDCLKLDTAWQQVTCADWSDKQNNSKSDSFQNVFCKNQKRPLSATY